MKINYFRNTDAHQVPFKFISKNLSLVLGEWRVEVFELLVALAIELAENRQGPGKEHHRQGVGTLARVGLLRFILLHLFPWHLSPVCIPRQK